MNKNELWKPCKGYEGLYEVSSLGRVRSCDKQVHGGGGKYYFKKGEIKKQKLRKDGYLMVTLYKNNVGKQIRVHRLVAFAFVENPNPEQYDVVNHIDCDRSNNTCENLEWVDMKLNYEHSKSLGRMKKPPILSGVKNPHSVPVVVYQVETGLTHEFESVVAGLRFLNIENPESKVSNVFASIKRNGIAYGCKWRIIKNKIE